jgi:acyl transferase domain-containing protein
MDPQQRLLLELGVEALEDAGLDTTSVRGAAAAVFVGCMWQDYLHYGAVVPEAITMHTATGLDSSVLAARISHRLGLTGPSLSLNTACSSGLVAVHLACQSLRARESSFALAAGVNLLLAPHSATAMAEFGGLSPDGRCRSFDAAANGYVRGEGGGVLVLKRLRDALDAGDRIYCLLRASAVNHDGAKRHIGRPSPEAQAAMLHQAYARAGIAPSRVHYIEAHGTGTRVGDPIEAEALGRVLGFGRERQRPLRIGSVKTNFGHTEAAAGIAGLIKVALAMRARVLPASLHCAAPNPAIDFDELRLRVQTEAEPWPEPDQLPLAGVNSFGFGGTNAHVVVQGVHARREQLLLIAADRADTFTLRKERLSNAVAALDAGSALPALCRASAFHWSRGELRRALVVRTKEQAVSALARVTVPAAPAALAPRTLFVFSGVEAVWPGMAQALFASEPVFRRALAACDRQLQAITGWSIIDALFDADARSLARSQQAEPLLFAVQVALHAQWRAFGVAPCGLLGHGAGKHAAAHCAGELTLTEAAEAVVREARLPVVEPQREHARFAAGLREAAREGLHAVVELGPHPVLLPRVERVLAGAAIPVPRLLASVTRGARGRAALVAGLGALYELGHDVRFEALDPTRFTPNDLSSSARVHMPLCSSASADDSASPVAVPFSAHTPAALRQGARDLVDHLDAHPELTLTSVAAQLARTRARHAHRTFLSAATRGELREGLTAFVRGDGLRGLVTKDPSDSTLEPERALDVDEANAAGVVFVFSGHGSQWSGMCTELLASSPVFRAAIERVSAMLERHGVPSLVRSLELGRELPKLRADAVQPLLFGIQVALAAQFRAWGLSPAAVIGHSVGEVAAAHVAGCLELEDAAWVIAERARAIGPALGQGAMALVELPAERAEALLGDERERVSVAVHQSPRFSVVSGPRDALERLLEGLGTQGIFGRFVDVDYASHGPQMEPLARELEARLSGLKARAPRIPMISTVTGHWLGPLRCDAHYFARNLREPVRFAWAAGQLAHEGFTRFLELSPHPLLASALSEIAAVRGKRVVYTPSLVREAPERTALHEALGTLYVHGQEIDWGRVVPAGQNGIALPPYPFQRSPYWKVPPVPRRAHEPPLAAAVASAEHRVRAPAPAAEPPAQSWRVRVLEADAARRLPLLCELLTSELARVLRLVPAKIEPRTDFALLGLDSLMGLELRSRLESALRVLVPAITLWANPSVDALAEELLELLVPANAPDVLRS